jgi:MoaA/NifB/PqqE/SkfB family radical SAM enzyme
LPEVVRAVHDGGAVSILFTSGAGFTENHARNLKQAGLWAVCVSLDTTTPEVYDRMRGYGGAFQRAIHTLRLSKKYGFYTMTGSVATRQFVEQRLFEQVYQLARKEQVDEMRIVEPMPCGKLAKDQEQCLLTSEHIATLRRFHIETNRRGQLPKICAFNQIEGPEMFGCAGGIQHLYIDSAGEVCPCDFTPMSFGNVTREDLADIWNRMQTAMNLPKQHCFIQRHHALIDRYREHGYPLPREISVQVCEQIEPEPLPTYYAMVLSADSRFTISPDLLQNYGEQSSLT